MARSILGGIGPPLKVRSVKTAGVDDVLSAVDRDYIGSHGHHRSKHIVCADDEPNLFPWVEDETDMGCNTEEDEYFLGMLSGRSARTMSRSHCRLDILGFTLDFSGPTGHWEQTR